MNATRNALASILLLAVLLSACTVTANNKNPPTDKKWLHNLVCNFPCWQNITPQETSFDDVLPILQKENIGIDFIGTDVISFQFNNLSGSAYKAMDGKVSFIVLAVIGQKISLGDIVQITGYPEQVAFGLNPFDTSKCNASAVFQNSGTILDFYLENENRSGSKCQINFNSDSLVFRIVLIGRDFNQSMFWKNSSYSNLDYIEWKGYGEYP